MNPNVQQRETYLDAKLDQEDVDRNADMSLGTSWLVKYKIKHNIPLRVREVAYLEANLK